MSQCRKVTNQHFTIQLLLRSPVTMYVTKVGRAQVKTMEVNSSVYLNYGSLHMCFVLKVPSSHTMRKDNHV